MFAYLKYRNPCNNSGKKHPPTDIVKVDKILKFNPKKCCKEKVCIVRCGTSCCEAVIGIIGGL